MRSSTFLSTVLGAAFSATSSAQSTNTSGGTYVLSDDLSYNNFLSSFDFFSGADPTNGFVQYQTKEAAVASQLVGYYEDNKSVFMGVDTKDKDPAGRKSVRVESTKRWNQGVLIADISHMPASTCGTWPAYWLLGQQTVGTDDWPVGGEIDLLEGVNMDTSAAITLHTSEGCTLDNASSGGAASEAAAFFGTVTTDNCDVAAADQDKNVGCSIKAPEPAANKAIGATYGTDFNTAGGGVYAMEWSSTGISVWFFPRGSSVIDVNSQTQDPSTFGTPLAKFGGSGCDYNARFKNMRVIFDTTFCGDWAGKEWNSSTCAATTGAATCQEYVQNNPEAFAESYWEIKGLKWFQKQEADVVQPTTAVSVPVASPVASVPVIPSSIVSVPIVSTTIIPVPGVSTTIAVPIVSVPGVPTTIISVPGLPTTIAVPVASPPVASVPAGAAPVSQVVAVPSGAVPASSSPATAIPTSEPGTGAGSGSGSGPMGGFVYPSAHINGTQKRDSAKLPRHRARRSFSFRA